MGATVLRDATIFLLALKDEVRAREGFTPAVAGGPEVSDVDAGGGGTTEGSAELKVTARFDEDFAMSVLEGPPVSM